MIHSVPSTGFTLGRRRMGMAPAAAAANFNPISAGIGAGVGLAVAGAQMWMQNNVRKNLSKSQTTAIVNQLEEQLRNLDAEYLAAASPSCADQRAALNAYDEAWQWLQGPNACGQQGVGSAGDACIADRAPSGRWPWRNYYRDPIANDPRLAAFSCNTGNEVLLPTYRTPAAAIDTATGAAPGSSTTPAATTSGPNYLLIGGVTLAAAYVIAKAL